MYKYDILIWKWYFENISPINQYIMFFKISWTRYIDFCEKNWKNKLRCLFNTSCLPVLNSRFSYQGYFYFKKHISQLARNLFTSKLERYFSHSNGTALKCTVLKQVHCHSFRCVWLRSVECCQFYYLLWLLVTYLEYWYLMLWFS